MFEAGPERERPRVGAFFDMDKTLIAENSGSLFMRHQYEQGEIDGFELLKGFGAYVQYKLGVLDIANWTRKLMLQFAGRSESDLERQTAEWFEELVVPVIYPEAEKLVQAHREALAMALVSLAAKPRQARGTATALSCSTCSRLASSRPYLMFSVTEPEKRWGACWTMPNCDCHQPSDRSR